jgi:hypothetical protein
MTHMGLPGLLEVWQKWHGFCSYLPVWPAIDHGTIAVATYYLLLHVWSAINHGTIAVAIYYLPLQLQLTMTQLPLWLAIDHQKL